MNVTETIRLLQRFPQTAKVENWSDRGTRITVDGKVYSLTDPDSFLPWLNESKEKELKAKYPQFGLHSEKASDGIWEIWGRSGVGSDHFALMSVGNTEKDAWGEVPVKVLEDTLSLACGA